MVSLEKVAFYYISLCFLPHCCVHIGREVRLMLPKTALVKNLIPLGGIKIARPRLHGLSPWKRGRTAHKCQCDASAKKL